MCIFVVFYVETCVSEKFIAYIFTTEDGQFKTEGGRHSPKYHNLQNYLLLKNAFNSILSLLLEGFIYNNSSKMGIGKNTF
jgi:hypothetical protein